MCCVKTQISKVSIFHKLGITKKRFLYYPANLKTFKLAREVRELFHYCTWLYYNCINILISCSPNDKYTYKYLVIHIFTRFVFAS